MGWNSLVSSDSDLTTAKNLVMIGIMRKVIGFIGALGAQLSLAAPVFAQKVKICPGGEFNPLCQFTTDRISNVISNVVILLLIIAIVVAIFFLIWGGIKWILSGGDKTNVEAARNHIVAALVGLAVAFLAFFLLTFVLRLFGINIQEFTIPNLTQ